MRRALIPALVVASMAFLAAPLARAQCATPESFASIASAQVGQVQVEALAGVAQNTTNQIARLWDAADSTKNNGPLGVLCPASAWWKFGSGTNRGINGSITATGCGMTACPALPGELTALVEDFGPHGPPGTGDTAYFIVWRVDADPTNALRLYNYARTNDLMPGAFPLLEFPRVNVTSSGRIGTQVVITANFVDVAPNHHGARLPGNSSIPATDTILSLDLMRFVGPADPGRSRSLWTQIATIPYSGAIANYSAQVSCGDTVNDEYLAVGVSFKGGAGPGVQSALVGRAIVIECDPNLADPQATHRPQAQPLQERRPQTLRRH